MAGKDIGGLVRKVLTTQVVAAFLLGLVVGLVVLGWWVWPVQWTNADPADLKPAHKQAYLVTIADSYNVTNDTAQARSSLDALKRPGETDSGLASLLAEAIKTQAAMGRTDSVARLQNLSAMMSAIPPAATPAASPSGTETPTGLMRIAGIVALFMVIGAVVLALLSVWQKKESVRRRKASVSGHPAPEYPAEPQTVVAEDDGRHLVFETVYNLGDEGYDVNFPILSPSEEFLGECGVSVLETVGIGTPERVTAFELWLFDKVDIRTVTNVIMSAQAFADSALRSKFASKGQLLQAQEGDVISLSTANLHLDVVIDELIYESGSSSGVFAKLALSLEVSPQG